MTRCILVMTLVLGLGCGAALADDGTNKLVNNINVNGTGYSVRFCFSTTDVGASINCADPGGSTSSDYNHGPKNINFWYSPDGKRLPWINLDSSCQSLYNNVSHCDTHEGSACKSQEIRDNDGDGATHTVTLSGTVLNDINGLTLHCSLSNMSLK